MPILSFLYIHEKTNVGRKMGGGGTSQRVCLALSPLLLHTCPLSASSPSLRMISVLLMNCYDQSVRFSVAAGKELI